MVHLNNITLSSMAYHNLFQLVLHKLSILCLTLLHKKLAKKLIH